MKKFFSAFTVLELIVVLGAVAILLTLGIDFILRFRSNVEIQTSYSEVVSAVKTLQNAARNSLKVFNSSDQADVYAIIPSADQKSYLYEGCFWDSDSFSNATCLPAEIAIATIKGLPAEMLLFGEYSTPEGLISKGFCGFERKTGKVFGFTYNASNLDVYTSGTCIYTLRNEKTGEEKRVNMDIGKSTIVI